MEMKRWVARIMKGESMPIFDIPCTWTMSGIYHIDTENLDAAIKLAKGDLPLPEDREYVSGSLSVDPIDEIFEANNMEPTELSSDDIIAELNKRTDARIHAAEVFDPATANYTTDKLIALLRDYYGLTYD